jgi:hypothetical protein
MNSNGDGMFNLLPALYRLRDAAMVQLSSSEAAQLATLQAATSLTVAQQQQLDQLSAKARGPLQSFLMLIGEKLAIVENDIEQLYDNLFIETCADWVIPYIGDLIGYQPVNGVAPSVASPRAEVAHTISLRRRKGTVLVLEQLARDVTGWGAHAVEIFRLLSATQYMNHVRPYALYSPDLRGWQPRAYIDTGFDRTPHTVDVRRIAVERGRYDIQNIGIFLWPLFPYGLTASPAATVAGDPLCFRFNPLGCDMPLFVEPANQGADITTPATPANVPDRLRRHVLCDDLRQALAGGTPVYYGAGLSLALYLGGKLLPFTDIRVCNLSGPDGSWANLPTAATTQAASIDPELGRIALTTAPTTPPMVSFTYGFSGDMAGGPYARAASFTLQQPVVRVPGDYATVELALSALGGNGVVEISDNGRYVEGGGLTVTVMAGGHVELRAQDGSRPTLVLGGEISVTGGAAAAFDMNGLLVTSTAAPATPAPAALVHAPATDSSGNSNQLTHLGVTHCTLVPGWALSSAGDPIQPGQPTLIAEPPGLAAVVTSSILGAMRIQPLVAATLSDSIVDANSRTAVGYAALDGISGGGALTMTGCTVIGKVHATTLSLACDSIFWAALAASDSWIAPLLADRKQEGCVRFSYLPEGAITPRKFECVLEEPGTPGPLFASTFYRDPNYARLLAITDDTVRRGAHDGGEMGAFHFVQAPQRETDLRVRMTEYLSVGLEYGIFYQI